MPPALQRGQSDDVARNTASLPVGLGVRSAIRTQLMVQRRHPEVAVFIVEMLNNHLRTPCFGAAAAHRSHTSKLARSGAGSPPPREPKENEPGISRTGSPHERSVSTETVHDHDGVRARNGAIS